MLLLAFAPPAVSQLTRAISGSVVDAATDLPIARVTVTIVGQSTESLLRPSAAADALALARTTFTSDSGRYEFADLPIGAYRLYIRRTGYLPATVDVELSSAVMPPLSVGLVVAPVSLRPVVIRVSRERATADDGDASAIGITPHASQRGIALKDERGCAAPVIWHRGQFKDEPEYTVRHEPSGRLLSVALARRPMTVRHARKESELCARCKPTSLLFDDSSSRGRRIRGRAPCTKLIVTCSCPTLRPLRNRRETSPLAVARLEGEPTL